MKWKNNEEKIERESYGNFEFVKQNSRWSLEIENFRFSFKYNPDEVEKIETNSNLKFVIFTI